ncbi:ArsR/SmtB family transcription factor [Corynebacterium aquilae]|uniref:ArsR family transcriptional regulator n=1 Tax=Corynebacterium aquilae DSM 44791 TaxID=1431546 RepID=A0A1L7CHZ3_9CORY|nr:metalloregulator ArsR/SmtB family transcription factor [Corynebacterium aquilae]APT85435.1 ArsR family transcriptional regulator [Corynebacterium aquilae DSM 44791]
MHADSEINEVSPDLIAMAAEVMRILADPTRLAIILELEKHGELGVNALAELVGKKPSGVSQHLAKMRFARLVTTRQEGTSVLYRLVDEHALALAHEAIRQAEHAIAGGQIPPHHR